MDDIYDLIMGSAPTSQESQRATAAALRRRRQLGELGALTGDRVLRSFGEGMSKQADDAAGRISDTRLKEIDDAQTKSYQDSQISHMGNVLEETSRHNRATEETALINALAALWRSKNEGDDKPARLRQGDIKELRGNASALATIGDMLAFEGELGQVEMGGVPLPGARQALNAFANMGWGTEGTKETALMWQNYQRFYDLAERNALFGATLTPNEQAAWRKANPSSAQTDEQIKEGLRIMQKVYQHAGDEYASGLIHEGYSPEAIDSYRSVREPQAPDLGRKGVMTDQQKTRLEELRRKRDGAK